MCVATVSQKLANEYKQVASGDIDNPIFAMSIVPGKKDNKPISSVEDLPATRVLRKRELVSSLSHDNEILNLELTRESREVRKAGSSSAAAEISRSDLRFTCARSRLISNTM